MSYELAPSTEAGRRVVEASESLIDNFRGRAATADERSEIDPQNFSDLLAAGITSAFLPESSGGFGLASIHDWMALMTRLGRGDGSVAIAVNMHLAVTRGMVAGWSAAKAANNKATVSALEEQFKLITTGEMYICATATEPGTDNLHPFTQAKRVDGGWRINGLKIFVTGSPIATHLAMNLRIAEDDFIGSVMLPMSTEGIVPQNDWQALGMKASGSQSVVFDNVFVAEPMVRPLAPWGKWSVNMLMNRNLANLPLLGAFVGIAEHAHEIAIMAAMETPKTGNSPSSEQSSIQHMIGEMEIALSTAQAMLSQMGQLADKFLQENKGDSLTLPLAHELLKDHQSMKWIVNKNAIEIVNKAMDIVGGRAFMDKHPLSRLSRDVRAGPFMQPFSPSQAREYIGKVVLGHYPES
jgi:alkylation response protein AidB-like acyl-CoA dehydrogenase